MTDQHNTSGSTSRTAAIAGFLIAGATVLILGMVVGRSAGDMEGDDVPALRIISPADGDTVQPGVVLRFSTPGALHLEPAMGWVANDLHLHAMLDSTELMPAAVDIAQDGDAFTWRLPPLDTGTHRLYLTWAGRHHGNLRGVTDTITLHVRP